MSKRIQWYCTGLTGAAGTFKNGNIGLDVTIDRKESPGDVEWDIKLDGHALIIHGLIGKSIIEVKHAVEQFLVIIGNMVPNTPSTNGSIDATRVVPIAWYETEGAIEGVHPVGTFVIQPSTLNGKYPLHYVLRFNGRHLIAEDTISEAKETAWQEVLSILDSAFLK